MGETGESCCDPILLSAYRDGALSETARQSVAAHLAECETCRQTLQSYAALGDSLRTPAPLVRPYAVRTDLRARLQSRVRRGWPRSAGPAVSVVASVAFVSTVLLAGRGAMPGLMGLSREVAADADGGRHTLSAAAVESPPMRQAPSPPTCAQPVPSVASVFNQHPDFLNALGCATDAPRMLGLVSQGFERGDLVRRSDTRELYVIPRDGRWRRFADPGLSAQPVNLNADGERLELSPWFGRVWVERPDLRGLLGRVASAWRQHQGLVQVYERGVVLWGGRGAVYVLAANGLSLHLDERAASPRDPQRNPDPAPTLETLLQGRTLSL